MNALVQPSTALATEITLQLENDNGSTYTGTITGKRLAGNDHVEVFLTKAGNVVVYDLDKLKYYVDDGQVDLEDLIGDLDLYLEVMDALGREATIALDV
jgi:hypothetical protein